MLIGNSHSGGQSCFQRVKAWAKTLKRDTYALYLACKHPLVPWYAKALAIFIVCYALSPIDLIPDFIPVLGYLDDLIIVPLGLWICIKLIPKEVFEECRDQASLAMASENFQKPRSFVAAGVIICVWLTVGWWFVKWWFFSEISTPATESNTSNRGA